MRATYLNNQLLVFDNNLLDYKFLVSWDQNHIAIERTDEFIVNLMRNKNDHEDYLFNFNLDSS